MSTSYDASVIFGFKSDSPISRDRKTNATVCLWEWLERHHPYLQQHNAGCSNGGKPDFFVGRHIVKLDDFTRSTAYIQMPPLEVSAGIRASVLAAHSELLAIDPSLASSPVGFYLLGDAA
jgi:hypothetical protein